MRHQLNGQVTTIAGDQHPFVPYTNKIKTLENQGNGGKFQA